MQVRYPYVAHLPRIISIRISMTILGSGHNYSSCGKSNHNMYLPFEFDEVKLNLHPSTTDDQSSPQSHRDGLQNDPVLDDDCNARQQLGHTLRPQTRLRSSVTRRFRHTAMSGRHIGALSDQQSSYEHEACTTLAAGECGILLENLVNTMI